MFFFGGVGSGEQSGVMKVTIFRQQPALVFTLSHGGCRAVMGGESWVMSGLMGGDWVTIFLADILDQFKVQDLII